jgi:dihydrofolate reductase
MSRINIIAAMSLNRVIGIGNELPWHLPEDLKYFKKITDGACVVMGRKCWESIPVKYRPLPNRVNVVVTRNEKYEAAGAATLGDINRVLTNLKGNGEDDEVFVIGGGEIYKQSFKFADRLFLTRIFTNIEGDIFLDGFNEEEWDLVSKSDKQTQNDITFCFEVYTKKVSDLFAEE